MTAALDELRRRLVTAGIGASGASTSTTSLFVDSLPEWPGISAVLSFAPTNPSWRAFGDGVPSLERPRVEVLVRSTAPAAGGNVPRSSASKAAADRIYRNLVAVADTALAASSAASATTWLSVDGPPPAMFDRDSQGRIYWRTVLDCWRPST